MRRMTRTSNTKENLCDTCFNRKYFPKCISEDVEFGDGIGNDNIIACSKCNSNYSDTIYPGELTKYERSPYIY